MVVVKILKRKDASSLIVGVVIAMIVAQFLGTATLDLASKVANWQWQNNGGGYAGPPNSFQVMYLQPFVAMLLELVFLEVLIWVYLGLHRLVAKKN